MFNFDTNEFLDASIEKVVHTLFEAFILVFIVVYIFLQDFRSTLIPAIAVPVSIVGAFFFLNLLGYFEFINAFRFGFSDRYCGR
jgi:HAE1 family hydrophobic/amphiphilic exporter-1